MDHWSRRTRTSSVATVSVVCPLISPKGSDLLNLGAIFRVLLSQLRVRHSRAVMIDLTDDLVVTTILFHTKVKVLNTGWSSGRFMADFI